jgi:hypothetical protein
MSRASGLSLGPFSRSHFPQAPFRSLPVASGRSLGPFSRSPFPSGHHIGSWKSTRLVVLQRRHGGFGGPRWRSLNSGPGGGGGGDSADRGGGRHRQAPGRLARKGQKKDMGGTTKLLGVKSMAVPAGRGGGPIAGACAGWYAHGWTCTTTTTTTTTVRSIGCQAPVTYLRNRANPRFHPLPEDGHGASL